MPVPIVVYFVQIVANKAENGMMAFCSKILRTVFCRLVLACGFCLASQLNLTTFQFLGDSMLLHAITVLFKHNLPAVIHP